jgi:hypothetical protein
MVIDRGAQDFNIPANWGSILHRFTNPRPHNGLPFWAGAFKAGAPPGNPLINAGLNCGMLGQLIGLFVLPH